MAEHRHRLDTFAALWRRTDLLALALLAALLPNLFFLGHPLTAESHAESTTGTTHHHAPRGVPGTTEHEEHARHCHAGLATCGDQPVTSGPGQMLLTESLMPQPPARASLALPAAERSPASFVSRVVTPPPRPSAA
ncbi:MAG TPA: hypothetical protein VNL92_04175 [Dehalococcoidia bacterium]|nr:hypothetical protein [Dehalococcoidia bacterium]